MGSNKLPFGIISGGYSCSEQYDWQQLALCQREQSTMEQPQRGANLHYPMLTPSRIEKSSPSFDRFCDYPRGADGHIHATPSLCKAVPFNWGSATQNRHYQDDRYLPTGFWSGHFSEIDEARHWPYLYSFGMKSKPDHTSPAWSHPTDEASMAHTNKRPFDELHHIHPEQSALSHNEIFYDHLDINQKGRSSYNGKMFQTKRTKQIFRKNYFNGASRYGGTSCKERHREQLSGQKAKKSIHKRFGDQLFGQKAKKHNGVANGACKEKPQGCCSLSELDQEPYVHHKVHHGGSGVMINDNREGNTEKIEAVDLNGAKRNCYLKKNTLTDATFCGSTKSNENSGVLSPCYSTKTIVSLHEPKQSEGRTSCKERHREQLSGQKAKKSIHKRFGDQLFGQKAKKHNGVANGAYKEKPQGCCSLSELDQEPYVHHKVHHGGSGVMINDNQEENTEKIEAVDLNGEERNCYLKKNTLTDATFCVSTKSNENSGVLSPWYSTKTIVSSHEPKQSEGSSNMKLESDKRPSFIGCPKSPQNMKTKEVSARSPQNLPVTRMEKGVHTKELGTASELLRECLHIWRRRRLRKDSAAEAEKIIQTNRIGASRNGRSTVSGNSESNDVTVGASGHSESMDENDAALENSKKCRSVIPPDGVQKDGERRTNCNKSFQNRMDRQGLECNLELLPDANPGEIMQQKEQIKLPCCLPSIANPEARIETSQNSCSDTYKTQICWNSCSDTGKVDQAAVLHPGSSVRQMVSQHEAIDVHLDARRKCKLDVSFEIKNKAEDFGAKWREQMTSFSTGPTVLDQRTAALCSLHDGNVSELEYSNQNSETSSFTVSKLDNGTANKCAKKPASWSSGSACRDIQGDIMNCNIFSNELVSSALADSENNIGEKQMTSNEQISHQSNADVANSVARSATRPSCFVIPDLNCLPSMATDEDEEFEASEEGINHVTGDSLEPQDASRSFSAPFSGPGVQEEQFQQPEKTVGGICERKVATGSRISDSHSELPQQSTVDENSTFKSALAEFIKNILRPLWEDGLLSRDVHKIIVKKAVEKVTITLGTKVPRTEIAICRFLAEEESQSVEKLVQGYLDVYLGSQVLKRTMPDNI